jgi:hypothetical protein
MPLDQWFIGVAIILNSRVPLTCRTLAGRMGVTPNTAATVLKRVSKAMKVTTSRLVLERIAGDFEQEAFLTIAKVPQTQDRIEPGY